MMSGCAILQSTGVTETKPTVTGTMMKKEFGSDYLSSDIYLEDEPYIISTIKNNCNYYQIKVSQ